MKVLRQPDLLYCLSCCRIKPEVGMEKDKVEIRLESIEKSLSHVNDGLECLLVINGTIDVEVEGRVSHLEQDGIIVVNIDKVHSIIGSKNNIVFSLRVGKEYLKNECEELLEYDIRCDSSLAESSEDNKYYKLKRILTRMLVIYLDKKEGYLLEFKAHFFLYMQNLFQDFRVEKTHTQRIDESGVDSSLYETINYINKNYQKHISLEKAAEKMHMSSQYFSRFFKRKVGIGFLEYIRNIRLEHALLDLIYKDDSILSIAMNNGFANQKSFTNAFKVKYGDTPGSYRKNHSKVSRDDSRDKITNKFNLEIEDGLLDYQKYIIRSMDLDTAGNPEARQMASITVNIENCVPKTLIKPDKIINIVNIDSAIKEVTMEQLKCVQEQLGFKYVYFNIYTENMVLLSDIINEFEFLRGGTIFYIFKVFSDINLIPFISIDYSQIKNSSIFGDNSNPIDFYDQLLSTLIKKFPEQYVSQWKFELVCSRNEDCNEFCKFYCKFTEILRNYIPDSNIGLFAIKDISESGKNMFFNILTKLKSNAIYPGFVSFGANPQNDTEFIDSNPYVDIKNYYKEMVEVISGVLERTECRIENIYMPKWNTIAGKTVAEAGAFYRLALIVDAYYSICEDISGLGFYLDTIDNSQDNKLDSSVMAVFIYYKIKRPIYFGVEALNRMGSNLIFKDEGIVVTKSGGKELTIVVFNPCYVNPTFTLDSSYIAKESLKRHIEITGLQPGAYLIKTMTFDSMEAHFYYKWINAGFPDFSDVDVIDYLENSVLPKIKISNENIRGRYGFDSENTFNGVSLYVLKKI